MRRMLRNRGEVVRPTEIRGDPRRGSSGSVCWSMKRLLNGEPSAACFFRARLPVRHPIRSWCLPVFFAVIGCEQHVVSSAHDATIETSAVADVGPDSLPFDVRDLDRVSLALCLHASSFSGRVTTTWCGVGDVCCRLEFILPAGYHDSEGSRPLQCQPQAYCADGGVFDAGIAYVLP